MKRRSDDFLKGGHRPPPRPLEKQSLRNDRWDRKIFDGLLEEMREFRVEHNRLGEVIETAPELWADAFWSFWKILPEMTDLFAMDPSWMMDHVVMGEAQKLSDFERTKFYAEGDDVAAAMATIAIREDLEALWDKNKHFADQRAKAEELRKRQQQLEEALQEKLDLDELLERWGEGHNPDLDEMVKRISGGEELTQEEMEQRREQLEKQIQSLQARVAQAKAELMESIERVMPSIRIAMGEAMEKAADEAETINGVAVEMWGQDPGQIHRMSADERVALAKRLNNERFRRLHEVWGPIERTMQTEQKRRVRHAIDEVVDVTLGRDLPRVLPTEFARLHDPDLDVLFFRDFSQRRLRQLEMEGWDTVGRGDIICEIDVSGSMMGEKEIAAKAVALCCLHLSRKQKRGFYGVHFGSRHEITEFDFGKGDIDLDLLLRFAEEATFGGTNFERPLSLALEHLQKQHAETGVTKADVVFLTDGICQVSDAWMQNWKAEKKRLDFKCFGIIFGGLGRESQPLHEITDGKVLTFRDLIDNRGAEIWRDM